MTARRKVLLAITLVLAVGVLGFVPFSPPGAQDAGGGDHPVWNEYNPHNAKLHLTDTFGNVWEYVLNPRVVNAVVLIPDSADTTPGAQQARDVAFDLIASWYEAGMLEEANVRENLGPRLGSYLQFYTITVWDEDLRSMFRLPAIQAARVISDHNPPDPPDACIKLSDCTLWCDGRSTRHP